MSKLHHTLAALYLAAAIVTFGHAADQSDKTSRADYAQCLKNPQEGVICWNGNVPAMAGILGGAFWPLYWSWEAWKP